MSSLLRYRCHSIFANLPALKKRYTHQVWIIPVYAVERGINENDTVHVFDELEKIAIRAKVTDHIMQGIIAVFEGTWFDPNEKGIDEGGCANIFTTDNPTPAGAFPFEHSGYHRLFDLLISTDLLEIINRFGIKNLPVVYLPYLRC